MIVGSYGGVLEALLAERSSTAEQKPLGSLMRDAHDQGHLIVGTRLCALATILLYFRNHIHPNKERTRVDYFIDRNVAKGLKVATDVVIADLLAGLKVIPKVGQTEMI